MALIKFPQSIKDWYFLFRQKNNRGRAEIGICRKSRRNKSGYRGPSIWLINHKGKMLQTVSCVVENVYVTMRLTFFKNCMMNGKGTSSTISDTFVNLNSKTTDSQSDQHWCYHWENWDLAIYCMWNSLTWTICNKQNALTSAPLWNWSPYRQRTTTQQPCLIIVSLKKKRERKQA